MVETAAEIKVLLPVTDPKNWAEATAGLSRKQFECAPVQILNSYDGPLKRKASVGKMGSKERTRHLAWNEEVM